MGDLTFERGNWLFELIEQYSQFIDDCNWYTYHFAKIEIENEAILGGYEATVVILGLGIRIRWNHTETDTMRDIRARVDEIARSQGGGQDGE